MRIFTFLQFFGAGDGTFSFDVSETTNGTLGELQTFEVATDFEKAADTLQVNASSGATSMADLTITREEVNAAVEWSGGLILVTVDPGKLDATNFTFV